LESDWINEGDDPARLVAAGEVITMANHVPMSVAIALSAFMIAFLLLLQPAHAAAVAVHGCDCLRKAVMPRCASAAEELIAADHEPACMFRASVG
jgi:hypothetical protein